MKILVLGGTRFFGKRLVALLIEQGHAVTIATRGTTPDRFGSSVQRITLDRRRLDAAGFRLTRGWDVVYDQLCFSASDARAACRVFAGSVGKLIFTSSTAVYRDAEHDVLRENDYPSEGFAADEPEHFDYGVGKQAAESTYARLADCPTIAVRVPFVLGDDDYTGRFRWHVRRLLEEQGIYFPNPDAVFSCISSAEVARALAKLKDIEHSGALNLASHSSPTLRQLLRLLERSTGKAARLSDERDDENESPYGISRSMKLDTTLAQELGCSFEETAVWLEPLARSLGQRTHGGQAR